MNRTHAILAGTLAVQVLIGTATWWPRSSQAAPAKKLLDLDKDAITALTVQGKPAKDKAPEPVKLQKKDGNWVLASDHDYPAQSSKVDDLLDKLTGIEVHAPEATRAADADALKVGTEDYGKIVTLTAGDKTDKLYVGASGHDRVHVRLDGKDDVYEAKGVSEWAIKDSPRGYFDTSYVDVDPDKVSSLTIANPKGKLTFRKADKGWTVDGLPDGKSLDDSAVQRLVKRALKVRMSDPVGTDVKPEYGLAKGVRVEWTTADQDKTSFGGYTIGATHEHDAYVKSDGNDFVVDVADGSVKQIREASLDGLLAKGS